MFQSSPVPRSGRISSLKKFALRHGAVKGWDRRRRAGCDYPRHTQRWIESGAQHGEAGGIEAPTICFRLKRPSLKPETEVIVGASICLAVFMRRFLPQPENMSTTFAGFSAQSAEARRAPRA